MYSSGQNTDINYETNMLLSDSFNRLIVQLLVELILINSTKSWVTCSLVDELIPRSPVYQVLHLN